MAPGRLALAAADRTPGSRMATVIACRADFAESRPCVHPPEISAEQTEG